MAGPAQQFNAWLDDFLASYYRHRPVNATFIGRHAYDDRLPDYSEQGVADATTEMRGLAARLAALPPEPLSPAESLDRAMAAGFLAIQDWEFRSAHFQAGNPCIYTGEAIFGVISLFLRPFAPAAQRVEAAIARLEAVPRLLAQGQANVRQAPTAWTARAVRECRGAAAFLSEGIPLLQAQLGAGAALSQASARAARAFAAFEAYLTGELAQHPRPSCGCGEEALALLLRQGHFVEQTASEIAAGAAEQMAEARAHLEAHAAGFGASTWQAALAGLVDLHPGREEYYNRYAEVWQACLAAAQQHHLVNWPGYPLRYVPQPAWARAAAPLLYFLFYRAPAAFDDVGVVDYLVTPIEADMPPAEQERLLRANNDSVIKLNHVIHHGSIGHHLQNWHAYRSACRLGQIAAVDCASRIAMFCGGTMAEGWACYATDLMAEAGFLTPLETYSQHQARLRQAARAVVDVNLHCGLFSLEEAVQFYQQQAGMAAAAAQAEAVKNSMFPGAALMYLVGTDAIHALRRELAPTDLPAFHDALLAYGSAPVALVADLIRQQSREGREIPNVE